MHGNIYTLGNRGMIREKLLVGGVRILGIMTGRTRWYFGRRNNVRSLQEDHSAKAFGEILAQHGGFMPGRIIYLYDNSSS